MFAMSAHDSSKLTKNSFKDLASLTKQSKLKELGTVVSVKDGVVRSRGLSEVKAGEMVKFVGKNLFGMAKLRKRTCGIVIFGNDSDIKIGDN